MHHRRHGENTDFVELIWAGLLPILGEAEMHRYLDEHDGKLWHIKKVHHFIAEGIKPKIHTIRKGKRWKKGDVFSPRVWSGKPYNSKQIQFAPDLELKEVLPFESFGSENQTFCFNNEMRNVPYNNLRKIQIIANNDGLSLFDFLGWFDKPMQGQCLIFGDNPY